AASLAIAVRVCDPLPTVVVFQEIEYGDDVSSEPTLAPSTRNCTPATPTLSEAEALTVVDPDTVAPDAGAEMLTEGGVVSAFETVTLTGDEVVRLPAASRAVAVRVSVPTRRAAELQEIEYGDDVSSEPTLAPSTRNCTPATPTLSEAEALTVVDPDTVAPDAGAVMLTEGGVASVFETVTVTGDEVVRFPAASLAIAVRVCDPLPTVVVFQGIEYGDDVSCAPRLAPSSLNCTPATRRLPMMVTLALTVIVPETVEPEVGDVMSTIRVPPGNCAEAG